jgi:pimeloyl-ACP methyl ester carboxylesterase
MSTYVLVHGAWHGGWCWKRVRKALQSQGHDVFTPTLTGVADRSHLLSPHVDLETHIADVVNLLRWEELEDVVLCGHSYAGCVVTGVADRVPESIRAVIYLDAFVPEDGQSLYDTLPAPAREAQLEGARKGGDGWRVPPIPAEVFNVNAADRAWVNAQCTPQPVATFQQRLRLHANVPAEKVTYVLATGWENSPFPPFLALAQKRGWSTVSVACGHDVMLDLPDDLTRILRGVDEQR